MEIKSKPNKSMMVLAQVLVIFLGVCCFIAGFEAGWYGFLTILGISFVYAFFSVVGIIPIIGPAFYFIITYYANKAVLTYSTVPTALKLVWLVCGVVSIFLTLRIVVGAGRKMKEKKAKGVVA